MGILQVLVSAILVVLVVENGRQVAECAPSGTYSYTTVHKSSSSNTPIAAPRARQQSAVSPTVHYRRSDLSDQDYRKYLPVEDTPEVKKAKEQFFTLYKKQARLVSQPKDTALDGTDAKYHVRTAMGTDTADEDMDYHYYYDEDYEEDDEEDEYEDEEEEEDDDDDEDEEDDDDDEDDDDEEDDDDDDEDDDDEDEEDSDEEDEDEEDSDEEDEDDEDDSDSDEEDSDSSSSSEEDGEDSSEEGEDSSSSEEDGEDSSSEEWGEDSSSSSSSSSEEDEDQRTGLFSWRTPGHLPLNTNSLVAPQPVTDTPEVKEAKRKFFDLYKTQAELSFNAPDDDY